MAKNYWICERCEEPFDSEEECIKHEKEHDHHPKFFITVLRYKQGTQIPEKIRLEVPVPEGVMYCNYEKVEGGSKWTKTRL